MARRICGRISISIVAFAVLTLSGCSWWQHIWERAEKAKGTPEILYQRGYDAYQDGWYKKAIEYFQRLRDEFPLHSLALIAEMGIADSHYSDENYGDAEIAYSDFVNLHPTNENVPYALYQLGMCHYKQMYSIDRDQTETKKAIKEFERLISRFPASRFSLMAEKMVRECKKNLGEHEFYVGHFYFKNKQYKAALKRFETVTKNYADLGLDYKVNYFMNEAKRRLAEEESKKNKK